VETRKAAPPKGIDGHRAGALVGDLHLLFACPNQVRPEWLGGNPIAGVCT
jgi:hypothetical protein